MFRGIIEGWANLLKDKFNLLDPEIKKVSVQRLMICNLCKLRTGDFCNPTKSDINIKTKKLTFGCGCVLTAKTTVIDAYCPLNKW